MTGSPLSRPVVVASVPAEGVEIAIVADEAERAALAELNGAEAIERFEARVRLKPVGRNGLTARGELVADAVRLCVVTLEPFVESLREDIDARYVTEFADQAAADAEDAPDLIENGVVDVGALASEFFTLGLDPHPKKPGAQFDPAVVRDPADSPFAALRELADRVKPKT